MAYVRRCLAFAFLQQLVAAEEHRLKEKDWEVGGTLLGAMVFMMCLHYVTNSSDPDMRRYANEVINVTIGIFCAVLTFQTFNEIIEMSDPLFADHSHLAAGIFELVVRGCVVSMFYILLQVALAYSSNMFMSKERYKEYMSSRVGPWRTKISLMTLCIFCAHVTAFATISMWGSLQQDEWFKQNPLCSLLTVVLAALWLGCLGLAWRFIRHRIVYSDNIIELREKMWIKATVEAENDVMAMALSFLLVQVLRFAIVGRIPDAEGQEHWHELKSHDTKQVLLLIGSGVMFAAATWILLILGRRCNLLEETESEEADEEEDNESMSVPAIQSDLLSHEGEVSRERTRTSRLLRLGTHIIGTSASRTLEVAITLFSMMFAWCAFFASKWMVVGSGLFKQATCGLTICHALLISVAAFLCIFVMDKIDDCKREEGHGDLLKKEIEVMIKAFGILVGFSWEQSFDIAVGAVAHHTSQHPIVTKSVLAFGSVLVVYPAWRLYIAPMVHGGWQFGFVAHHVVEKARELTLQNSSSRAEKFAKDYKKMLHHLQTVHHQTEVDLEVTSRVFDEGMQQSGLNRQNHDSSGVSLARTL